ncbi:hypothetical protein DL98DRAFT_532109 [Cadophora sp. DSE1049]|nr:hypothetical protein DL98DRAFT_532109 [Cadophora sp. DSE1049]
MARPATRNSKKTKPLKLSDTKIGTFTADELRKELDKGKISIPDNSLKPHLQALYKVDNDGDEDEMEENVEEEGEEEEEEPVSGADDEKEAPEARSVRKGKETAPGRAYTAKASDVPGDLPTPDVLKLCLTIVHSHVGRTRIIPPLDDNSISTPQDLLARLNKLPKLDNTKLDNTKSVARAFAEENSKTSAQFLSVIQKLYGDMIISAPEELIVKSMPKEIIQFVVAHPTEKLKAGFDREGGNSRQADVYFHGTSIGSLHSILLDGFTSPTAGYLSLVQELSTSFLFAFKCTVIPPGFAWDGVSFSNHGVILGCEVVNVPKRVAYGGVHTTQNFGSRSDADPDKVAAGFRDVGFLDPVECCPMNSSYQPHFHLNPYMTLSDAFDI